MTKVVLQDAETVAAFDAMHQRAAICDPAGRILGYYIPRDIENPKYYRGVKSPLSPEERERILREEGNSGKSLAEFWDDMRRKHPEQFQ